MISFSKVDFEPFGPTIAIFFPAANWKLLLSSKRFAPLEWLLAPTNRSFIMQLNCRDYWKTNHLLPGDALHFFQLIQAAFHGFDCFCNDFCTVSFCFDDDKRSGRSAVAFFRNTTALNRLFFFFWIAWVNCCFCC